LDRLFLNKKRPANLGDRFHNQHSNLGLPKSRRPLWTLSPGVRLDANHPKSGVLIPCLFTAYSECSYFGGLIGILHPYSVLRILGENAKNREADVVWQYGPLVQSGWATEAEFTPGARRTQTFLVATEGSSDARILKHAFAILHPEIADFFRFIDVSERHPFPGTGNLLKFAEGLAKIDVQNQVVFLLDNDAEGFDAYQRVQNLSLPSNMRAIMLPDLEAFRAFPARGPEGVSGADINRRAAAIESIWISISADIHRRKSCGRTTRRSSMPTMGHWNSRTPTPRSF
ncbi:MAG: HEPN/Toprim-associated domain-containing protein, partial [Methylocella sp.]